MWLEKKIKNSESEWNLAVAAPATAAAANAATAAALRARVFAAAVAVTATAEPNRRLAENLQRDCSPIRWVQDGGTDRPARESDVDAL